MLVIRRTLIHLLITIMLNLFKTVCVKMTISQSEWWFIWPVLQTIIKHYLLLNWACNHTNMREIVQKHIFFTGITRTHVIYKWNNISTKKNTNCKYYTASLHSTILSSCFEFVSFSFEDCFLYFALLKSMKLLFDFLDIRVFCWSSWSSPSAIISSITMWRLHVK